MKEVRRPESASVLNVLESVSDDDFWSGDALLTEALLETSHRLAQDL